ncbi:S-adenosyl-L-methionine-dependent methyltransferase [Ramaria rubella]|nr:S-adenosyl-L-methionine-dependent methyltransferase [Ramaria rubella]
MLSDAENKSCSMPIGVDAPEVPKSSAQIRRHVTSAVADAMLNAVSFNEDSTLVLDYACGLGALSQKLAPYCKCIMGVDIDPAAVEQYNSKVDNQGISAEEMHAICVDLHEQHRELEGKLFDVIVCSQAYHHFLSIDATTRLLASFLKPETGSLLVSDLLKGQYSHEFCQPRAHSHHGRRVGHNHHTVVHKGGLTETEIRNSFQRAGLVDFEFEIIENVRKEGRVVDIFLAQGTRPPDDQVY